MQPEGTTDLRWTPTDWYGPEDDTTTTSRQNVNASAPSWVRLTSCGAFSQPPVNGDGVMALNRVLVCTLQAKAQQLPRSCPLRTFCLLKADQRLWKGEVKARELLQSKPSEILTDHTGLEMFWRGRACILKSMCKTSVQGFYFGGKIRCPR